jgi:Ca2+-binding EF-hand superfamily protein
MGNSPPLAPAFSRFAKWKLRDSVQLFRRFRDSGKGFLVDFADFAELLQNCEDEEARRIVEAFSPGSRGHLNIVAFVSGLIMVSRGSKQSERLRALFNLFDFDRDQRVNDSELGCLLAAAQTGVSKLTGKGVVAPNEDIHAFAEHAFETRNLQAGEDLLLRTQFVEWANEILGTEASLDYGQRVFKCCTPPSLSLEELMSQLTPDVRGPLKRFLATVDKKYRADSVRVAQELLSYALGPDDTPPPMEFPSTFGTTMRRVVHKVCDRVHNLKSASRGDGEERHVVVKRKSRARLQREADERRLAQLKAEQTTAAAALQRVGRGRIGRRRVEEERRRRDAAVRIQSTQRGLLGRRRAQGVQDRDAEAARRREGLTIAERREAEARERAEHGHATRVQAGWRGLEGRRKASRARAEKARHDHATRLQAVARGRQGRRAVAEGPARAREERRRRLAEHRADPSTVVVDVGPGRLGVKMAHATEDGHGCVITAFTEDRPGHLTAALGVAVGMQVVAIDGRNAERGEFRKLVSALTRPRRKTLSLRMPPPTAPGPAKGGEKVVVVEVLPGRLGIKLVPIKSSRSGMIGCRIKSFTPPIGQIHPGVGVEKGMAIHSVDGHVVLGLPFDEVMKFVTQPKKKEMGFVHDVADSSSDEDEGEGKDPAAARPSNLKAGLMIGPDPTRIPANAKRVILVVQPGRLGVKLQASNPDTKTGCKIKAFVPPAGQVHPGVKVEVGMDLVYIDDLDVTLMPFAEIMSYIAVERVKRLEFVDVAGTCEPHTEFDNELNRFVTVDVVPGRLGVKMKPFGETRGCTVSGFTRGAPGQLRKEIGVHRGARLLTIDGEAVNRLLFSEIMDIVTAPRDKRFVFSVPPGKSEKPATHPPENVERDPGARIVTVATMPGRLGVKLKPVDRERNRGAVLARFVRDDDKRPTGQITPDQGVREGMEIIYINGQATADMNFHDIMDLVIERNKKEITFRDTSAKRSVPTEAGVM